MEGGGTKEELGSKRVLLYRKAQREYIWWAAPSPLCEGDIHFPDANILLKNVRKPGTSYPETENTDGLHGVGHLKLRIY